jgi:hypothetical protein
VRNIIDEELKAKFESEKHHAEKAAKQSGNPLGPTPSRIGQRCASRKQRKVAAYLSVYIYLSQWSATLGQKEKLVSKEQREKDGTLEANIFLGVQALF